MATTGITPGVRGASVLRSMYDAEIKRKANEEGVIHPDIQEANIQKVGDTAYIRVLPVVATNTATSTTDLGPENLTYETGTITRVSMTPTRIYAAIELPISLEGALLDADKAALRAGYRKQAQGALDTQLDVLAAGVWSGGAASKGPFDADLTNLLDLVSTIRTNAKEHVKNGTPVHLKYHPSQIKFVNAIAAINQAQMRGNSDGSNVKGYIQVGQGFTFSETGNIINSGGQYKNLAFAESAFAKGFNVQPMVTEPKDFGLVVRMFAYLEASFCTVFADDALVWASV